MKKFVVSYLFYFLILFFGGCINNRREERHEFNRIDLEVIDTVKVNYNGQTLLINDILNNKLAFFDFFGKEILITDLHGEILHRFNNSTLGSDNFGNQILGVRFQSDTSIAIVSDNGYFIYTLSGKMISQYKHPSHVEKAYMTGDFKLSYDVKRKMFLSLLTTATDLSSSVPDFYDEIRHLTTFKVDSQKSSLKIKYEPESSFLQKEFFTNEWGAHFDVDKDTIALIYGRDPIVYIYGLSDFKKKVSFKTHPQHFRQDVKFKFGENTRDNHKLRLTSFSNSNYRKIFIRKDSVITYYNAGIPLEVFKTVENLDDLNNIGYLNQQHYLQVFVSGKKEFPDYELPKEFPFVELLSNRRLILGEQSRWRTNKDQFKRFLIVQMRFTSLEASNSQSK